MSDSVGDATVVRCTCGTKLKVKPGSEGKKFKCPKCQAVVQVPVADTYDLSPAPEPDLLAGMKSLAASSKAAAPVAAAKATRTVECPRCNAKMADGAILCTACGYNTQTGRTEKGAKVGSGAVRKLAAGASPFVLGCTYTGLAALIGGAVWFLIAYKTGYEIGWIAWGIGGLTGFAMMTGYGQQSPAAGIIAAGMAAAGILGAKVAIFFFTFYALSTGDTSNEELREAFVHVRMAEEILDLRGVHDPKEREAQWESAFEEAERNTKGMRKAQIEQLVEKYKEDDERENAISTESGRKRIGIAQHYAELRAMKEGHSLSSNERAEYYKQEFSKVRSLDDSALDAETQKIASWKQGGKWEDPEFVRCQLIYWLVDEELAADADAEVDDFDYPEGDEWKQLHAKVAATVDAMSPPDRLARARSLETEASDENARSRLVTHFTEIEARRAGVRLYGDKWDEVNDRSEKRCQAMSHDEIVAEISKMDAWDAGGMWQDAAFVRDKLIYAYADLAVWREEQKLDPDSADYLSFPSDEQWRSFYAAAVAQADAVPPDQRRSTIERLQKELADERSRRWEEKTADDADESSASIAPDFFRYMFQPLDLLFLGLAVVTAFKVGAGSEDD